MFRARTAGAGSLVGSGPWGRRRGRGLGMGAGVLARVAHLVVSVIVVIIVAGILLVLLKANPSGSIVSEVHGWARSLAGPFDGIFSLHNARLALAVNWGLAAVVYLIVGGLIARLLSSRR